MKKTLLLAAATSIFASSAFAEVGSFYLSVQGYAFQQKKNTTDNNSLKIASGDFKQKTTPAFGFGVGYTVMDNMRAELTYMQDVDPKFKKSASGKYSNVDHTVSNEVKITARALLAKVSYDIFETGPAKFFVTAGAGLSQVSGKYSYTATPNTQNDSGTRKAKNKNNPAFLVGVGAGFSVAEGVNVDLGYAYRDYGKTKAFGDTSYKFSVAGHNLFAGLRFEL